MSDSKPNLRFNVMHAQSHLLNAPSNQMTNTTKKHCVRPQVAYPKWSMGVPPGGVPGVEERGGLTEVAKVPKTTQEQDATELHSINEHTSTSVDPTAKHPSFRISNEAATAHQTGLSVGNE